MDKKDKILIIVAVIVAAVVLVWVLIRPEEIKKEEPLGGEQPSVTEELTPTDEIEDIQTDLQNLNLQDFDQEFQQLDQDLQGL